MTITVENLRSRLMDLSGSKQRRAYGRSKLYATITIPGLDDMPGVRNTLERFEQFGVPERLKVGDDGSWHRPATFLDVGCNVGHMSFEAEQRGANVIGIEYNQDRVDLCNDIATHFEMNALFFQGDVNSDISMAKLSTTTASRYDYVMCCALDRYVVDIMRFYKRLRAWTSPGGTLYFESNVTNTDPAATSARLFHAGFTDVTHVGRCLKHDSTKREVFVAR